MKSNGPHEDNHSSADSAQARRNIYGIFIIKRKRLHKNDDQTKPSHQSTEYRVEVLRAVAMDLNPSSLSSPLSSGNGRKRRRKHQ